MPSAAAHASVIREELAKILASPGFARNERLGRFLRFVVERQLEGQAGTLKETVIAVEVFGRRPDYDPKLDSIVRTEAARLRARLAEYYSGVACDSTVIELPKGGYIPIIQVKEDGIKDKSIPVVEPWPMPKSLLTWTWRNTGLMLAGVVLLALGFLWWSNRQSRTTWAENNRSIAVLPFKNRSPEADRDYFVDGLTNEIIRNLSIIEGLEVRSQTSSFVFKDKQLNLREVGEKLNVNYVLVGAIQLSGEKLRVTTEFSRVSDGHLLWTGKFDKERSEIFAIQDDISSAIVNELRVKLGGGRRRYETSVEAYDLYLRAGSQSNLPERPGARMERLVSLYQDVIDKDPSFAPAYAKQALIHARQSVSFPLDNTGDAVEKLRVAAEKAIQLDPLLVEAHIAIGWLRARNAEWEQAEKSFREAIRLNPNSSEAYTYHANWLLEPIGRMPDALKQLRHAEKADPLSTDVKLNLVSTLISMGRLDEAAVYWEKWQDSSDIGANSSIRSARLRLGQGRITDAIQLLENHPERPRNPLLRGWLGNAYARSGRRSEAESMAAVSEFSNEQALIYAGLGDKDRTLAALESMGSRGPQRVGRFLTYPEFAFLRGDPRLAVVRRNVGLPQDVSNRAE